MRGMFDAASFPVPQGQRFPGLSGVNGYYTAANFPVPQGQPWPGGPQNAKVIPINVAGPTNAKVVKSGGGMGMRRMPMRRMSGGMCGQYAGATWSKAPFFAGTGMGQSFTTDASNVVSAFTTMVSDSPGTCAIIAFGAYLLLRKKF